MKSGSAESLVRAIDTVLGGELYPPVRFGSLDKDFQTSPKLRFTLPVEGWWTQRAEARR